MAEDIQEAVSLEDAPSKQMKTTQIQITHWENEDEVETSTDEPAEEAEPEAEEEPSEEETSVEVSPVEVDEEGEETDEAAPEEHEWHLIDSDEESTEEVEATEDADEAEEVEETEKSELDEDEVESPEWDEEKWQQANTDAEDIERPEWDDEKWQQANIDEEEAESPEWDEEKWQQANSETEEVDAERPDWDEEKWKEAQQSEVEAEETSEVDVEEEYAEPALAVASKTEMEEAVEKHTGAQSEDESSEETAQEPAKSDSVEESEEDTDQLSASQVALNQDDEAPKKRLNPKELPKQILAWWQAAKLRNSLVTAMALAVLVVVAVPSPRYAVLNTVGVRATASVAILDSETQLPLREVQVSLAGQDTRTNENGLATFDDVRLGSQRLTITKSAYDTYTQSVTIGVGDNQIQPVNLVAIGTSFDFRIVDWLTQEPVLNAEVTFGENSAFVNSEGVAKLNTPTLSESSITVTASADGYVDEEVSIDTTTTELSTVSLVLDRHHLFISKRDGTYDVYKVRADGSDEQRILSGTGNERDDLRFDTSPSGEKSVLVATRDKNIVNEDGFVLSGMYLIDTKSGDLQKVDSSERIDLVGWIGEHIVYVKVQAGSSGQNPERHRLMSLNTATGQQHEIAASNFFNDVIVARDFVFYAPSDAYKQNPRPYLFRSNADGSTIDTVFEKVVWTILRNGYDSIQFDSEQVWYNGMVNQILNTQADSRPTNFTSRLYTDNLSGTKSAWVDIRDGKGSLIIADVASGEESTLISLGGLRNPIVWLSDDHLIFRVVTSTETADYVLNVNGGEPMKITDVTDVSGADRWYYFY